MSDHADISDQNIIAAVQAGIAQSRKQFRLIADGRCHFCEEPTPPEHLFCNKDCRDDYELEQAALRRAGKW